MTSRSSPTFPPLPVVNKTSTLFFDWWRWSLSFFWTPATDAMAGIKTWTVTEPYLNIHCGLGEGPYYEAATNTLRFVDIKKKRLHTVDLSKGPDSLKTLQFDMPVGVTADIDGVDPSKKILIGGKSGVYVLDRVAEKWELLKRFYDTEENDERLRSNDGAIDPQGRFWIGTMNDFWVGPPQAEGECSFYYFDFAGTLAFNPAIFEVFFVALTNFVLSVRVKRPTNPHQILKPSRLSYVNRHVYLLLNPSTVCLLCSSLLLTRGILSNTDGQVLSSVSTLISPERQCAAH
jgi:hypothetical protein